LLNDLWIYYTDDKLWSRLYTNGDMPETRTGVLSSMLRDDRLLLLYGGSNGQKLYTDLW